MLTDGSKKCGSLANQLLAFDNFVFQFFAVLEVAGVFFFSFHVIVNSFNGKVGDEKVDIGLYLVQFAFEVHGVE